MALVRLFFQSVLAFACCQCASSVPRMRVDPSSGNFQGSDGRVHVFHGVNIVQKDFPWHPSLGQFDARSSLNAQDISDLKSWGLNVVRLGVMWPGVEPSPGKYNATYLQVMRQLVDDLFAQDIYTIVDFHQDAFTQRYCGEGVPDWLLPMLEPIKRDCTGLLPDIGRLIGQCKSFADYNYSIDPNTGFPRTQDCLSVGFDQYSRAPEVVSSWGNFYKFESVLKKLRGFWRTVAAAFASAPGVLGYDLLNEPLGGNFFEDAQLLMPGVADSQLLQPLYASLTSVIKSVDPLAIPLYEPTPFPDTYPIQIPFRGVYPAGFTAGPAYDGNQALSYHIYSCGFAVPQCDRTGDPPFEQYETCDRFASDAVRLRQADVERLGGAAFITEFGACSGSDACVAEINRITGLADQYLHSWAYWQFKYNHDITTVAGPEEGFYDIQGKLQDAKVAALSRTYAQKIAGVPEIMQYDPRTGSFRLRYLIENSTRNLTTEVFMNERMNYPKGYVASVVNGAVSLSTNRLDVVASPRLNAGTRVDVAVVRASPQNASGTVETDDRDVLSWEVIENGRPGITLKSSENITWWKGLKLFSDDGTLFCDLQVKDSDHGPKTCVLEKLQQHALLFQYQIEIMKLKPWGARLVARIDASRLGPLLGKQVNFVWVADKGDRLQAIKENIVV